MAEWERMAIADEDRFAKAVHHALLRVVSALRVRHGHAWGGHELIARLVTAQACNDFASEEIGRMLDPWLASAARAEGYSLLPKQSEPVVMNTKGASASGKSTLRPLQKALAGQIGVRWSEFALISPDIWRKQLLDYGSLGSAYKYGGAFTGDEVRIIDQKLDRYMAAKAARGEMSHLLIDRFRFDSFAPDSSEAGSNLLTRFGHVVYLFFMITPPESLVERAWQRGLEVGRYKAVDDTLAHCIDAYSGIPELFFTWIRRGDKRLRFEFLDNSVAQGARPRTVAFGNNDVLNILDVGRMLDIERFRRVNVDATSASELYADRSAQERIAQHRIPGALRRAFRRGRLCGPAIRPRVPQAAQAHAGVDRSISARARADRPRHARGHRGTRHRHRAPASRNNVRRDAGASRRGGRRRSRRHAGRVGWKPAGGFRRLTRAPQNSRFRAPRARR